MAATGENNWYTGSSGLVSGWICTLPSHKAAEDFEGSNLAGSERPPRIWGDQPAPIDDAIKEGTMVMMDDLQYHVSNHNKP